MQYHVFEINPFQQYALLQSCQDYRAARVAVRELRKSPTLVAGTTYRMMFAADPDQAERLLKEKREARPMGEHD